jgi:tetratricopeptide (TPR) repeat protein
VLLLLLSVRATSAQQPPGITATTPSTAAGDFQIPLPLDMQNLEPKVREAIEQAVGKVRADPTDDEAVAELGILYHANLLVELAVPCYRRARELAPENHQWRYLLAVVARHTGDAETARSELLALREAGVEYPPVFFHLGEINLDAAKLDEAEALFGRMIELDPQAAAGYFGLGRVKAQRGDYEKAVEYLNQAKDRAPTSEDVLQQLGLAYRRLAQVSKDPDLKSKARDTLLAARKGEEILLYRDPWRSAIHRVEVSPAQLSERARMLVDRGMLAEAEQIMREVVARQPNELLFITQLAGIKYRQGKMHEARDLCVQAVELAPKDPHAWEGLAETRRAVKDYEGAVAAVNAALELDPSRLQARYLRGRILLEAERPERALSDLQATVAADPNHAAALVRLADTLLRLHRDAEALPLARRAAELDDGSAYAHFEWGIALARSGDLEGSERALRRALELAPGSRATRVYLDWVQQQSAAAKSLKVDPGQKAE